MRLVKSVVRSRRRIKGRWEQNAITSATFSDIYELKEKENFQTLNLESDNQAMTFIWILVHFFRATPFLKISLSAMAERPLMAQMTQRPLSAKSANVIPAAFSLEVSTWKAHLHFSLGKAAALLLHLL